MSIPATLTLEQAARQSWDVLVVGAGPAGSLAARETARRGLAVLLVDKAEFPRWKVCGACINSRAQQLLGEADLPHLLRECGAVAVAGLCLASGGRRAVIPLPGEKILSREAFDSALVRAAVDAGAHFLPGTLADPGPVSATRRQAVLHKGPDSRLSLRERTSFRGAKGDIAGSHHGDISAKIVLAADGLGGSYSRHARQRPRVSVSARLGAGCVLNEFADFYAQPNVFMACGTGGYVGLVRLEDGRLNLAAAFDAALVRAAGGLARAAAVILEQAGLPVLPQLIKCEWRGTPLLTRSVGDPAGARIFHLGDAAGFVEPFTGEGMSWALASASAAAPLVVRACEEWRPEYARAWSVRYRKIVAARQRMCRIVAQVLRRPWLTSAAVTILRSAPALAAPLVRCFNR